MVERAATERHGQRQEGRVIADENGDRDDDWLLNDPASLMDPALIWPSLTALASDNLSSITLSTDGPRHTETMHWNDDINPCGAESKTSPRHSGPASFPATSRASELPATLIRTFDGRICAWSHGMERRYGFAASQAVGLPLHQLLRTVSCQALGEIDREFLNQQTWSGGFIHHRSDGRPIMTASFWHLHRRSTDEARFVAEVHADIVPVGSAAGAQLADVLGAIAHEMSEALTAACLYTKSSQHALHPAWPDRVLADRGLSRATEQIARAIEIVRLMRKLGEQLCESNRCGTIK